MRKKGVLFLFILVMLFAFSFSVYAEHETDFSSEEFTESLPEESNTEGGLLKGAIEEHGGGCF